MSDTPIEPVVEPTTPQVEPTPTPAPAEPNPLEQTPASVTPEPAPEPVAQEASWPDDWRQKIASGDDKKLKELERFSDPLAMGDSLFSAQEKIKSTDYQKKLSDNPSDEELTAYRKSNNIPEKADGYGYKLPEGFAFGEADKPFLNNILDGLHAQNASPAVVQTIMDKYIDNIESGAVEFMEKEKNDKEASEDALRSEWGGEYKANNNMVENFMSTAPEDVRDALGNGRGPDGTALFNNPSVVRWLNGIVREINPAASLLPAGSGDKIKAVDTEIAALDKIMNEMIAKDTWHGSLEQKRHLELTSAEMKMAKRR